MKTYEEIITEEIAKIESELDLKIDPRIVIHMIDRYAKIYNENMEYLQSVIDALKKEGNTNE